MNTIQQNGDSRNPTIVPSVRIMAPKISTQATFGWSILGSRAKTNGTGALRSFALWRMFGLFG